jgi:iron complex transport system substrate-binding protein
LDGIFGDIARVADALGLPAAGEALVGRLKQRLSNLKALQAGRRRPTLVMIEWTDPVFPMANWGPELVEFAHGELLLGKPNQHSQPIGWDDVREADPEFLIIAPCGFSLERTLKEIDVMESYPGWHDLRAVRNGNVFFADGNLYFNRSGTTAIDTAEMLADMLHGTSSLRVRDGEAFRRLGD